MTKYKWDSPADWLTDKLNACTDANELRSYATSLVSLLDSDQLQDVFQSEMAADGYFNELED